MLTDAINFQQLPILKISEPDIIDISNQMKLEPIAVWSVLKNETGGKGGFDIQKRPRILFEGHYFFKYTKAKKMLISNNELNFIYPTWSQRGNAYSLNQYSRLEEALKHDIDSAWMSASYGLGQLMGSNFKSCGFSNITDFIKAMYRSEKDQFLAMMNFIKSNPTMFKSLNEKNWVQFAKMYNGPSYAQNKYDVKLNETYLKNKGKTSNFI